MHNSIVDVLGQTKLCFCNNGDATAQRHRDGNQDRPTKPQPKKQYKQDESRRQRSIFEVPSDFFDSCRPLDSPLSSLPDTDVSQENALRQSNSEKEIIENSNNYNNSDGAKAMERWSCNTCKAEFESLQDQRFHFKSDLHRFNIKLSIAGKNIIKEEDFDEAASDSLCKDYDVSSISGSDEDERESSLPREGQQESGGVSKRKIFIQLQNGERVSVWRCLLLDESEHVSFETDKSPVMDRAGDTYLTEREVIEKMKYILHEPRDNTCLRIVLLARGGHFAGCVFDGNSLVAHKTFHREMILCLGGHYVSVSVKYKSDGFGLLIVLYVVRAKAGKKQSSKDAGGRAIHSAGASLRRYNEFALKKDIQELLYGAVFRCCLLHFHLCSFNNRQLFFDGDKPYFICQHHAIRNIPLTVRAYFKEASRIYSLLVQISYEVSGEIAPNTKQEPLSHANARSESCPEFSEMELRENVEGTKTTEACSIVTEIADLSLSVECKEQIDTVGTTTPLHEAVKSANAQKVLELLEQGLDPCIKDERGQTPYMLASEKEVRNAFRRFMASNLEKWDWHAAKVPSALTKEMEESQAAKQAEKDAKRKARAKELKKLRKAKEKKAQAEAAQSQDGSFMSGNGSGTAPTTKSSFQSSSMRMSKEEELKRIQDAEREKRAAAAERRIAAQSSRGITYSSKQYAVK
ncbi:UNVERIFIED_CONTAM: Ankyrin repeat and zinc finger domain-containing protein 1 [Sesamum latifolium]|uniref:Ankyrin repeat and zinc finger domain-containing protein 1 n=1 Tax=Sesamum latifolium TaxID=2727402 RepID=A0AAW2YFW4_9LAMI